MTNKLSGTSYLVHVWMVEQLHLSHAALLLYALIYSFTVWSPDRCYHGSIMTLVACTGYCRQTVIDTLKGLVADGYVSRREVSKGRVRYVIYAALRGPDGLSASDETCRQRPVFGPNSKLGPNVGPNPNASDPDAGSDVKKAKKITCVLTAHTNEYGEVEYEYTYV